MASQQVSGKPTKKAISAGVAGGLSALIVWVLNEFDVLPRGTQIPGEIASALTTVISFVVSYMVSPSPDDQVTNT